MKAQVTHFNARIGYYSATTDGHKIVFRLLAGTLLLNDIIHGALEKSGQISVRKGVDGQLVEIDIVERHALAGGHNHSGSGIHRPSQ